MHTHENEILEKLNLIIDENLDNVDFKIEVICKKMGMSRAQLHRILTEKTQLSTTLYIRKRRLEKAKYLLATTGSRISEIADAVGINNAANFSKYFIEEFDVSPSDFRRQLSEQQEVQEPIFEETLSEKEDKSQGIRQVVSDPTTKTPFRHLYVYLLIAFVTGLATVIYIFTRIGPAKRTIPENSIAILPFKSQGTPENTLFSDGVTDQIHSSLSLVENLRVISQTSSQLFRNTQKSVPQIGNELRVKYILEGSVLQLGPQIRITVKLILAEDDTSLWTKNYEGNTHEVFSYMSKVAKEVANELNQKLSRGLLDKLDRIPTKSLAAYDEFLRGRQLMESRSKEKLEAAVIKLSHAIEIDPEFTDAYTHRASAYFLLSDGQYIEVTKGYQLAEKDIRSALQLYPENGFAYAISGNIYRDQNKWQQADASYRIALKYSPNNALINYWYSLLLRTTGRLEEAMSYSAKAVESDPLTPVIFCGYIYNCTIVGRLDIAQKYMKEGELLFNDSWIYHWNSGIFYVQTGDYRTALKFFNKAHELSPHVRIVRSHIFFCKAKLGYTKEINDLLKPMADVPDNYSLLCYIYAGLNDKERCMYYFQKNADLGIIPSDISTSPFFKLLSGDRRFEAVLQKFGLRTPLKPTL